MPDGVSSDEDRASRRGRLDGTLDSVVVSHPTLQAEEVMRAWIDFRGAHFGGRVLRVVEHLQVVDLRAVARAAVPVPVL